MRSCRPQSIAIIHNLFYLGAIEVRITAVAAQSGSNGYERRNTSASCHTDLVGAFAARSTDTSGTPAECIRKRKLQQGDTACDGV